MSSPYHGRVQANVFPASFQMSFSLQKKFQGLETSRDARYYISKLASALSQDQIILLGLSGRGDKDMDTVAKALDVSL